MTSVNHEGFDFVRSSGGISEYKAKSNGLTVLLLEDHSAPVATVMVTYRVGSRHEVPGYTGATHLLEHLMFKGSKKFNKDNGKTVWSVLQTLGAAINATTYTDRTNYFELLPSSEIRTALEIEADRMRTSFIREEDRASEMTVVRNEYERGENEPSGSLSKAMWAAAFQAHAYHHSTIGWRSDIEKVPIERLRAFYDQYYHPNNATLSVIGDLDPNKTLDWVQELFGIHPASTEPIPEPYTTEPVQEGPRRVEVRRPGRQGLVQIAYKAPPALHPDSPALTVLGRVLGVGKSSRLYRAVVDKSIAQRAGARLTMFHDGALFWVTSALTPGTSHEDAEKELHKVIDAVKTDGVTEEEVQRAVSQIVAQDMFSRDGTYSVASNLNEAIARGDWRLYTNWPTLVSKVTAADVNAAAKKYLVMTKSTTGWFIPLSDEDVAAAPEDVEKTLDARLELEDDVGARAAAGDGSGLEESEPVPGLWLHNMTTGVSEVITIRVCWLGGNWFVGPGKASVEDNMVVAEMTSAMLDQGTLKQDKFAIAAALEEVGASVSFGTGDQWAYASAKCRRKDAALVIALMTEQIREPKFDEKELENLIKRQVAALEKSKERVGTAASIAWSARAYPADHLRYYPSVDDEIAATKAVTSQKLREFHETMYGLGSMHWVVVGDCDAAELTESLKAGFGDGWRKAVVTKPPGCDVEPIERSKAAGKVDVHMPGKASCSLQLGHTLPIDRAHPDYYPLFMAVYVLGGNFSARLMSTVRDKQGLTYGINSGVSGVDGSTGHWKISGTFAPENVERGLEATMEQVKLWLDEGITAEELAAKKSTLVGSHQVGLATTSGLASSIQATITRELPRSWVWDYPKLIEGITLEAANEALKKHVRVEDLLIVTAGTIPEKKEE